MRCAEAWDRSRGKMLRSSSVSFTLKMPPYRLPPFAAFFIDGASPPQPANQGSSRTRKRDRMAWLSNVPAPSGATAGRFRRYEQRGLDEPCEGQQTWGPGEQRPANG